jgi:hypothetical protein
MCVCVAGDMDDVPAAARVASTANEFLYYKYQKQRGAYDGIGTHACVFVYVCASL